MKYQIKLPRSVRGDKLISLCEIAAAHLGWRFYKNVTLYSISPVFEEGSPVPLKEGTPLAFKLEFRISRRFWGYFGKAARTLDDIYPEQEYSELNLQDVGGNEPLTTEKLEDLASMLYSQLR